MGRKIGHRGKALRPEPRRLTLPLDTTEKTKKKEKQKEKSSASFKSTKK